MKKVQNQSSFEVPKFNSLEEEAAWLEANFTKYWKHLKPAKDPVMKNLSEVVNIRLDPETSEQLVKRASDKGVKPTTFARMLIKEALKHPLTI